MTSPSSGNVFLDELCEWKRLVRELPKWPVSPELQGYLGPRAGIVYANQVQFKDGFMCPTPEARVKWLEKAQRQG